MVLPLRECPSLEVGEVGSDRALGFEDGGWIWVGSELGISVRGGVSVKVVQ